MNVETNITPDPETHPVLDEDSIKLLRKGLAPLEALAQKRDTLREVYDNLAKAGDRSTLERTRKLSTKLAEIEPAITMIGQVKAGKTSLVNAMVGMPGLLPSDVNPWTSVVTSLHLDPTMSQAQNKSHFQFFNRDDWDRLVVGGGRIGELARRAGSTSELERVSLQIAEMQEKSRTRLGNKFELLLGQEHDYGYFDKDLIERYVCLGDDFEDDTETSKSRGRFADITKSAEVFMHNPALPIKLCIRDTPGVNDTFLVREQITIRAIRGSQICVVVLAAHQALSTVDLALIRLISNIKSRDVIIFVNRIDELADPATQVPEIRDSLKATLREHQGPEDATILFGSAHWANQLLEGRVSDLDADSSGSLLNYARATLTDIPANMPAWDMIWRLSGLEALHEAVSERVIEGAGKTAFDANMRNARNLLNSIKLANGDTAQTALPPRVEPADLASAEEAFAKLETQSVTSLNDGLDKLKQAFEERIERVHQSFLERATAALITHLENAERNTVWQYDPSGLRMLLRSSYGTFAKRSKDLINQVLAATSADCASFFEQHFALPPDAFDIHPPEASTPPAPVVLGQTISLDLQTSWWASWWQKQTGAKAHAKEFSEMIAKETAPIFDSLRNDYVASICVGATVTVTEFLAEHRQVLDGLARRNAEAGDMADGRKTRTQSRLELIEQVSVALDELQEETGE